MKETTMLENGLDFILSSLIHLENARAENINVLKKEQELKYCLLHLSSGIELILKSKLYREHWTYIFSDMNKAQRKLLENGKFKSVESNVIIERLKQLCEISISGEDEKNIMELRNSRNRIEHFMLLESIEAIENKVKKSIKSIINFIGDNYSNILVKHNNIVTQKLNFTDIYKSQESILYQDVVKHLAKLDEHYEDAIKLVKTRLKNMEYKLLVECPVCREPYLMIGNGDQVYCYFCAYRDKPSDAVTKYINNFLEDFIDNDNYPLHKCPDCGMDTVIENKENQHYICFSCGSDFEIGAFDFCAACGKFCRIQPKDKYSLCKYCYDNGLMKTKGRGVKRKNAERILLEVLERIKTVNQNKENFLYKVKNLVVFGNYLSDHSLVGSLDLCVELAPIYNRTLQRKKEDEILESCDICFSNYGQRLFWPQELVYRFLRNKSRIINFHDFNSIEEADIPYESLYCDDDLEDF